MTTLRDRKTEDMMVDPSRRLVVVLVDVGNVEYLSEIHRDYD